MVSLRNFGMRVGRFLVVAYAGLSFSITWAKFNWIGLQSSLIGAISQIKYRVEMSRYIQNDRSSGILVS